MRLEDIRAAVADEIEGDLEDLRASWISQRSGELHDSDEAQLEDFLAWLHQQGAIRTETFRSLHAGDGVKLNDYATLATFYGEDDGTLAGQDRPITEDEEEDDSDELDFPDLPPNADTSLFPIRTKRPQRKVDPTQRLTFLGQIAGGAMGEIHIARDRDLQRKIAVKRMTPKVKRSPTLASRFYTEAQITAQLDHPNIVPVYSLEPDPDGGLTYTMKLIKGRTFADLIQEIRERYDKREIVDEDSGLSARLEWFLRVCDAISYAHSRGVIHRDLKPDNVMVGKFGEVFVMDWGIARLGDRRDVDDDLVAVGDDDHDHDLPHARTRIGTVIGTPAYMSPEQAEGNNDLIDGRSDEFALGLVLFELVCLKQALTGRDTMSLLLKVQRAELEPISPYPGAEPIAPELQAIIRKATSCKPDQRYATVKDLADDVRRHLRGEPVLALPEGVTKRLSRWMARHVRLLVTVFMVAMGASSLVVIGALTTTLLTMHSSEVREQQMSSLLGVVAGRAHDLDAYLLTYEGLLKVLSSNAVEVLDRDPRALGPAADSYYLREPFAPPDITPSSRYGSDVSIGWPVFKRAEGISEAASLDSVRQLTLLRPPLRRLLLSSSSEDAVGLPEAAERKLILEDGTPIAWAYVALENGVLAHYPGHDKFPSPYDARKRPWYELARGGRGPHWGSPHVDFGGLGLMLPCSMGLYDDEGRLLGVAGIELSFDFLIDRLLEAPELASVAETYILDASGRIVIQSSDKKRAGTDSGLGKRLVRMKSFPYEKVVQASMTRPSGNMVVDTPDGKQLFVWDRMKSTGWTYIIRGNERDVMRAVTGF